MRRQKCAQCGTMLDISKLEGGSKFACASCGAILVVGEATAVKRSLKESGPAFTPKGKTEAPAPSVPSPSRRRAAETERPTRRGGETAPKSKLPLYVGIAVVAVGVVVAIVLSSGSGGGPGGTKAATAADWWAKKNIATASESDLRTWIGEAQARGYDRDAAFWTQKEAAIYEALLKKAPQDEKANERAGNRNLRDYPDFDKVWEAVQSSKQTPAELQDFLDTIDVKTGPIWMTPRKYDEVSAKLDEFLAWKKKLDENPAAEPTERFVRTAKTMLSSSQRKVGFASVAEAPFVLLLAYEDAGDGDKARADITSEGRKWANALKLLREEFDKRIREPLGLPAVEPGKYYCEIVVPTADDLRKLVREGEGLDATGDIPAYFSPNTKWAHLREPKEANEKALFGGDVAHEAVHQLQWHFSNDPVKKFENYMEAWNGIWLTEGLAEYLGGGIDLDPASGKASFSGRPPRRVEFLRAMRDNGVPLVPVRELVQFRPDNFPKGIANWKARIGESEELPEAASQWLGTQEGLSAKLLYAESWLLVHFLYEADDGKYRAKLLDLVLTAFRGGQKPDRYRKEAGVAEKFGSADEAFSEIMGLKDEASWQDFQHAVDRHAKTLRGD